MAFLLEQVVPWGRSFDEYVRMFGLTETELNRRILGCGDGPAAFNAEMTQRGGRVVSIDPVYLFTTEQIKSRIAETYEVVMAQMRQNQEDYIWNTIPSVKHLGLVRMAAMESFLIDFETGKQAGRYIAGELPLLPFEDAQFDIALSSHFLFLYSAHLSYEFHIQALKEMLRVADEIRVFPLLTLDGKLSPHLAAVKEHFANTGFKLEIKPVAYEFQRGGHEMLVIMRA
jgi:hypothetical protein